MINSSLVLLSGDRVRVCVYICVLMHSCVCVCLCDGVLHDDCNDITLICKNTLISLPLSASRSTSIGFHSCLLYALNRPLRREENRILKHRLRFSCKLHE